MKTVSLKARILTPLSLALIILLGAFAYNVYRTQVDQMTEGIVNQLASVQKLFERRLESESKQLNAIINLLTQNQDLQQAWLDKDREQLLALASPLLTELRDKLRFTHFYFHGPDRVNFLRVYNPSRYGDKIERMTLKQAEATGRPASGIELGKLGTLTLRSVHPWRINGEVVGFIEMGEEIDHVIDKIHDVFGIELYVSIYKEFLDRRQWENGMKLLGRESQWDRLPSSVIVSKTPQDIPKDFADFLVKGEHEYMEMASDLKITYKDKRYRVGVIPLFDGTDREVGDIVVLYDITPLVDSSRKTIIRTCAACLFIGLILLFFFSRILGSTDKELTLHRLNLEEMVQERTEKLQDANANLQQEVGERQKVESQLQRTKASLQKAHRIAKLGNWTWHVGQDDFSWSMDTSRIFGQSSSHFHGMYKDFLAIIHPEDLAYVEKSFEMALYENIPLNIDHRILLPNQTIRIVHQLAEVAFDDSGQPQIMTGTVQDVTERRQMEQTVQVTRNLESLGVLAGGIAHDFNNLLTGVFCNIELVKSTLQADDESFTFLEQAAEASKRAKHLTSQLLTFSKGGTPLKENISIAGMLKDTCNFVLSGSDIRCSFDVPPDLWQVRIDKQQMEQVFHNLILNAKEAMHDGGSITVTAKNMDTAEVNRTMSSLANGQTCFIRVSITDTGQGIPREIMPKIFDPYFSTKEMGAQKGTGLGLAICHSIMSKHQGHVTAESDFGSGATFTLYLPAISAPGNNAVPTAANEQPPYAHAPAAKPIIDPSHKKRILLMDDEEVIIQAGTNVLTQLGVEVITAGNGHQALDIYTKATSQGSPIDLVILDLTIRGGMGGRQTMEMLRQIDPQVKAVVASGYADDPVMADFARYGFLDAIEKPFDVSILKKTISTHIG